MSGLLQLGPLILRIFGNGANRRQTSVSLRAVVLISTSPYTIVQGNLTEEIQLFLKPWPGILRPSRFGLEITGIPGKLTSKVPGAFGTGPHATGLRLSFSHC